MYNNEIKRGVQALIFSNIKYDYFDKFIGLADFGNGFSSYRDLVDDRLKIISKIFLNKKGLILSIIKKPDRFYDADINKEFNIADLSPGNIMDCDFCSTYKTSGNDLLIVIDKMNNSKLLNKYILFTFSTRGASIKETLSWMNNNIFDKTLFIELEKEVLINKGFKGHLREITHNQFKYSESKLYSYRNGGSPMLTGLIKL